MVLSLVKILFQIEGFPELGQFPHRQPGTSKASKIRALKSRMAPTNPAQMQQFDMHEFTKRRILQNCRNFPRFAWLGCKRE
ncbi:hypothetical protein DOE73_30805 [Paenibacillus dendritiformis]|nr:hypothetical protein DOE73_30805 [Paenibacillus dendritiformis]